MDRCAGRQCGLVEGGSCGTCTGATEVCDDLSGQCEDACADRECGEPLPGISCGQCSEPERCGLPGRCFVPGGCPSGTVEVGLTGVCIDAYEKTWTEWAEFLNAHGGNECLLDGFEDWNDLYRCYSEGAVGSFVALAQDGNWKVAQGYEQYPAVFVSYPGARLACEHWGKRLCAVEEWAQACEGPEGNLYPYGDTYEPFTCNACNSSETLDCTSYPKPDLVGSFPSCEGGYLGLYDMSGNVWEWAMDYEHYPHSTAYTSLGGYAGVGSSASQCRSYYTIANNPYAAYPELGFRCCFYLD